MLRINVAVPHPTDLAAARGTRRSAAGSVVFVGSVAARLAPPAEAVYAASKAAITAYAECLQVDLGVAGSPVGVHVVQPGVLATELFELPDNDASLSRDRAAAGRVDRRAGVLTALGTGATETFVPTGSPTSRRSRPATSTGSWQGAVQYTRQRLDDLGRSAPTAPGGTH